MALARFLGWRRRASVGLLRSFSAEAGVNSENDGWSWSIRRRVLDSLDNKKIAKGNPRHSPNFPEAEDAAHQVMKLPEFEAASCVYVQTDLPLKPVRASTLKKNKLLVLPCMVRNAFLKLDPAVLSSEETEIVCNAKLQSAGIGQPLELDSKFTVDLIVLSSVAVDPSTGARIGMGEGAGDLQYALLHYLKAIDDSTPILTMVDDKQLVHDIPPEKLQSHDVPVDIICTPTKTIHTNTRIPRPKGIQWHKIQPTVLSFYKVFRDLRRKVEREELNIVTLAPPSKKTHRDPGLVIEERSIFIRGLNPAASEAEVEEHLKQLGVPVVHVRVYRPRTMPTPCVVVRVVEGFDVEEQVSKINNSELRGCRLMAERYQKERRKRSK